jgi:hypothetical protein
MSAETSGETGILCDACGEIYTVQRGKTVPPFLLRALEKNRVG